VLFMLSFEEGRVSEAIKKGDFSYVKNHFETISTKHQDLINKITNNEVGTVKNDSLIEIYMQLLREDRTELYPVYLSINYAYGSLNTIDSSFLQNLNILVRFYRRKQSQANRVYESKIFNSINLDKITEKFERFLDKDGKLRSSSIFKLYMDKLDLNLCLNSPDRDADLFTSKLVKFCVFANIPSIYELGMIKTCILKFKSMKGDKPTDTKAANDDKVKKIASICQLYLYLSYPLCSNSVLNSIANNYFS